MIEVKKIAGSLLLYSLIYQNYLGIDCHFLFYSVLPLIQIYCNIVENERRAFNIWDWAIYFDNIFYILLFKKPYLFLVLQPNSRSMHLVGLSMIVIGFILMKLQEYYGPFFRFQCLRNKFINTNGIVFEQVEASEHDDSEEVCAICNFDLRLASMLENVVYEGGRAVSGEIVRTPCNHNFHLSCLKTWTSIRNVCPLDQRHLPHNKYSGYWC